jgi:hypothetical protein
MIERHCLCTSGAGHHYIGGLLLVDQFTTPPVLFCCHISVLFRTNQLETTTNNANDTPPPAGAGNTSDDEPSGRPSRTTVESRTKSESVSSYDWFVERYLDVQYGTRIADIAQGYGSSWRFANDALQQGSVRQTDKPYIRYHSPLTSHPTTAIVWRRHEDKKSTYFQHTRNQHRRTRLWDTIDQEFIETRQTYSQ